MNYSEIQELINSKENILFSGGAKGADTMWGDLAKQNGHEVIHYHFDKKVNPEGAVHLSNEYLEIVDVIVHEANESLQRHFPSRSDYVNNLIRRNAYQIIDSDRIYAVAPLQFGLVHGGTAWAVQMYLDKMQDMPNCCEAYLLDSRTNNWFKYDDRWIVQDIFDIPAPNGKWAGVGSRDLPQHCIPQMEDIWLNQ